MTTLDPFVTTARTLPVVPRPITGESFQSWMVRISAASRTSLDLILTRIGIYEPTYPTDLPLGFGVALDPRTLARTAAATDEGGRGLYLVEQLATRWGSRPTPEGKAVWFEIPLGGKNDS